MCTSTARLLLAAAVVMSPLAQLPAQQTGIAAVGERVRVRTAAGGKAAWHRGTVLSASRDSITLQDGTSKPPRAFDVASITEVGVSRGRLTNSRRGMGYGFLAGAGVGALIGVATYKEGRGDCSFFYCTPDYKPAEGTRPSDGAILGAVGGLIVGGMAGRYYRTEKWRRRPVVPGVRMTLDAGHSGGGTLAVEARVAFVVRGH